MDTQRLNKKEERSKSSSINPCCFLSIGNICSPCFNLNWFVFNLACIWNFLVQSFLKIKFWVQYFQTVIKGGLEKLVWNIRQFLVSLFLVVYSLSAINSEGCVNQQWGASNHEEGLKWINSPCLARPYISLRRMWPKWQSDQGWLAALSWQVIKPHRMISLRYKVCQHYFDPTMLLEPIKIYQ